MVEEGDLGRTFCIYEDGSRCEIAYRVRLLKDVLAFDGAPDEIAYQAGEVLVMNAVSTVHALSNGYGRLLGDIVDGVRGMPQLLH